ncbi:MAG TPA: hypothetical protein VMW17_19410 [Candidatus Binatia bacterium]|nr:hypothetical protein [Candidatus Binatia bacterium]
MRRLLTLLAFTLVLIAGLFVALRPAAEEIDSSETPKVSDKELQTYIGVYSAMQSDHDLTIEHAIEPYQVSLEAFRGIERRVQADQRLIDKARQALLTQAQSRSAFGSAPTPTFTPAESEVSPTPTKRRASPN